MVRQGYRYEGSPGQEGMMKRFRGLYTQERQLRSKLHTLKEEMKRFLELGQEDRCLGLFYLGWLKEGQEWPKSSRSPISEKVSWFNDQDK